MIHFTYVLSFDNKRYLLAAPNEDRAVAVAKRFFGRFKENFEFKNGYLQRVDNPLTLKMCGYGTKPAYTMTGIREASGDIYISYIGAKNVLGQCNISVCPIEVE